MSTIGPPEQRAILHVADEREMPARRMQDALLATGRTVVRREDLYRGMGVVAASRQDRTLEAIVVDASIIGREDTEFFQLVASGSSSTPVFLYGESDVSFVDQRIRLAVAERVTPDSVAALFPSVSEPTHPPVAEDRPVASVDTNQSEIHEPPPPTDDEQAALPPAEEATEVIEEEELPPVEDGDQAEAVEEKTADGSAEVFEPPPVPWLPRPNAPVRVPPNGPTPETPIPPDGEKSIDAEPGPLLSREELEALLNQDLDSPDSAEHSA